MTIDLPMPAVAVDMALGPVPADPWVQVASSDDRIFLSGEYQQGASRWDGVTGRYEAGRLSVTLDNADGRFDPTNLDGPYVVDGLSQIHPMRGIRLRAIYDDPTIDPIFTGFMSAMPLNGIGDWSQVSISATDGSTVLSNVNGSEQSPQGAGETTGERLHRIADNAQWPSWLRDIDLGETTVQATTLAQNAWTEMQLVADTELGELYFDGRGFLRFRNRLAIYTDERSSISQATFSNRRDGGALPWDSVVINHDLAQLRNRIQISRAGGTQQVVEDLVSQVRFSFDGQTPQPRSWGRNDLLMEDDDEALQYASFVLYQSSNADLRFDSMVINPQANPTVMFPHVLGRRLGDRITGILHTADHRAVERDVFIRGIRHSLDTGRWVTSWALQDAARFAVFILDHPILGRLDFNRLAY